MSYADAAAKGPKQSPEDYSRAPELGGIYKDESESTASLIDVDSPHVTAVDSDFLSQEVKTTTQAERLEREAAEEEKKRAEEESNKKAKPRKAKSSGFGANSDNPVYIGNAVLYTLVGAGLSFGAYHKHARGKLSWETIGLWSGAVGAVGVVDYFVSKWFLQNKYPPK
ncbi:hypothetical protein N7448_005715 [Penicillium atrosanguineum]|uniref:Mitochondrial outer membrane protein OM14 C-terminal domain-containing protein n=1 Tax=Penicillium atrosanguineum TaxID=1132637 RepID=A0A9W9L5B8_9EURO|nr:UbiA prenyltransferase family-domain-containing protein [Penicillium atrosanguineum]KAJ5126413.1 hypothetical protein N7526_008590 [Penicillium atrosanguineum]KAJ5137161.1 hypothetical protein N7448_005715 [Penicillium atrosanguineum]KAJ5293500.1 UbiA prenyltransferase family-domain-containing protein [Penicillium atrosanguineum]KAJ5302464.1 hypothetical protein N7476_009263 [Penicillium atrosanguineum]